MMLICLSSFSCLIKTYRLHAFYIKCYYRFIIDLFTGGEDSVTPNRFPAIGKMIIFRIRKVCRAIVLLCITTIIVFYTGQLSSNSLVDFVKNALRPLDRILSPRYCACLKCMTQPDDDLWFQKRFNTSLKPFLTRKYKTLSNDTRMWWQVIKTFLSTVFYYILS